MFPIYGGGERMLQNIELKPGKREPFPIWKITSALVLCLLGLPACTGFRQVIPAPMVFEEQSREILKVTPLGTQKEQVVKQLEAAGISGEFASTPSIYYCDLWERKNGKRWHLNVALLFNEAGELYKTRPAQADVSWKSDQNSTTSSNVE